MSKLVMDAKLYAKLLNSVSQQGAGRRRPMSPVECARAIRRLIDEEQESLDQIAARLNLGRPRDMSDVYKRRDTTQISLFLNLLKVSKKSRDLAGWGTDDWPRIPFSTVAQLHTLTEEDQDAIIQSILQSGDKKRTLTRDDVVRIKRWRRENPEMPIRECIENVLKLKPTAAVTHMVVMEIRDTLRRLMDSDPGWQEKVLEMLNRDLPGTFHGMDAGRSVIAVSMDDEAYGRFHEYQYGRGLSYTRFFDEFLGDKIG